MFGTDMRARLTAAPACRVRDRRTVRVLAVAALALLPEVAMASIFGSLFAGTRPTEVGTGVLAPCPDKPNCVRSGATDPRHAIAPIAATAPLPAALAALVDIAAAMPGARVVTARADYAHLEFATPLMGFVDDVELAVDATGGVIQVRSASRVGTSDFGVNRKRIDDLRRAFAAAGKAIAPTR
jgi:uncharacterized protein (DUF1499 family)